MQNGVPFEYEEGLFLTPVQYRKIMRALEKKAMDKYPSFCGRTDEHAEEDCGIKHCLEQYNEYLYELWQDFKESKEN